MRPHFYIEVDGQPEPIDGIEEWGQWFETADRVVARTEVGEYMVSTVFLAFDHNWTQEVPPILYETLVFGHPDEMIKRYETRAQAEAGHQEMIQRLTEHE